MKVSKSEVEKKVFSAINLKFEEQTLTSFSGLVIFEKFFKRIGLKSSLSDCFKSLAPGRSYKPSTIFLQLIFHVLLGYRTLQDNRYYKEDPLVKRVLGLKMLPDTATISRSLKNMNEESIEKVKSLGSQLVIERLEKLAPNRLTLDFDGTVQSTKRRAEGVAVGYNKKKKGNRSYYPLFCTIAQTGQVFSLLHRSGNVHDSNGAKSFILSCIDRILERLPNVSLEVRMDSAFFSEEIIQALHNKGVEFTVSVPFERFPKLKAFIEERKRWGILNQEVSFFEQLWSPDCWDFDFRFLFIRNKVKKQKKGVLQLDFFEPQERGYEFKVIVTNKTMRAKATTAYHEGRGSQEAVFAELKSQCQLDYVPVNTKFGNQAYMLAAIFAYNLNRELQMQIKARNRNTNSKRASLWVFEKVETIRRTLIQRAGKITNPKRSLTLTVGASHWFKEKFLVFHDPFATLA